MVELWVVLLLYGGGVMDDLPLLERRGVRRVFGWARVPHPATFGRWLRAAAEVLSPLLDDLLWRMVRRGWAQSGGAPRRVTVAMDSTVVVRYGLRQAGAERGYNPKKRGRPSHHPLLAYVVETGDCLGVRWRPGRAHTARGAEAWLAKLVDRLRKAGVRRVTVRLDKGFFGKRIVARMEELGVSYLLKVPRHAWLDGCRGAWEVADRNEAGDRELRTASGELWGTRLLSVERRKRIEPEEGALDLVAWETTLNADVLTNIGGIGPVEAWRAYNAGAVVEQRIGELGQLSAGRTAVDDLGGNALPWRIAVLAYQLLHILRSNVLGGRWRAVQPRGIRLRLPARARQDHLPRPPNLAPPRVRRPGPRPPAARPPDHRAGSPPARARLSGPDSGLAEAPRGGAPSRCLREPPQTLPGRPAAVSDAQRRLENAPFRSRTTASAGHNRAPPPRLSANAGSGVTIDDHIDDLVDPIRIRHVFQDPRQALRRLRPELPGCETPHKPPLPDAALLQHEMPEARQSALDQAAADAIGRVEMPRHRSWSAKRSFLVVVQFTQVAEPFE